MGWFDAVEMFSVLACVNPSNIPMCIFTDLFMLSTQPMVKAAVALLKKYSIISASSATATRFNVHPLVQRAAQLSLDAEETQSRLTDVLTVLKNYFLPEGRNKNLMKFIVLHAESAWSYALKDDALIREFNEFPTHLCMELHFREKYDQELKIILESLPSIERVLGSKHLVTIALKCSHAWALYELKQNLKSFEILKEILPLAEKELGSRSSVTTMILTLIEFHLDDQGKHDEEMKIIDEIVVIHMAKHGSEHPKTLGVLHGKACALVNLGRVDEAVELFRNVYEVRKRVLGQDRASTLITMQLLGAALLYKKEFEEALGIYEALYESKKRRLGKNNPSTLKMLKLLRVCKVELKKKVSE